MTEPAEDGGAGSGPSMMQTTAVMDGNHWVVNGRKAFITGADGARVGIVMAKSDDGACMFPGRSHFAARTLRTTRISTAG